MRPGLMSDEHFSVDGTLIDAWASLKIFRKKDEKPIRGLPFPLRASLASGSVVDSCVAFERFSLWKYSTVGRASIPPERLLNIESNSGDSSSSAVSAICLISRSGCFEGTRFSGVNRLSMLACFVSVPRMLSNVRERSLESILRTEFQNVLLRTARTSERESTQTLLAVNLHCRSQ
jgi:hypothetical protein